MLKSSSGALGYSSFECEFKHKLADILPALRARARSLARTSVDAEDLVHDTVLRAMGFAASYAPDTNLRAWLQQILFSVFITRCRKSARERRALDALANDPCGWPRADAAPLDVSLTLPLRAALDALPAHFSSVVRLVDLEQHSYKEAAIALDIPVGTVMSRLFRGRRLLADALPQSNAFERAA
jgi:RNA polymerase sigma-70 factor, ECF subfamily